MTIEQYITNRVDNQLNWFNRKAKVCKLHYYIFSAISIITSTLTPIFVKISPDTAIVTSLITTIILTLNNFYKFKDKWNLYRITAEFLQKEKTFYLYSTSYSESDDKFIERIEYIISESNKKWNYNIHKKEDKKKLSIERT